MNSSFTTAGRLHSPFRTFVRDLNSNEYVDLVNAFNLHGYEPREPHSMQRQLAIVPLDDWTLFADDWFYTLWHMPSTMRVVADAAKSGDVYYDLVGDCDESYSFGYFRSGSVIRQVTVDSPNYSDQILETDVGTTLPVESDDRKTDDIEKYVDSIAQYIGIRLPNTNDTVLAFGPSKKMG